MASALTIRGSRTWTLRNTATAGVADAGTSGLASEALPVVGDWNGDGVDGIGTYVTQTANWSLRNGASAGTADVGTFQSSARQDAPRRRRLH